MANASRYVVSLTGTPVVGPSVSVFTVTAGGESTFGDAVRAFYNSIAVDFPSGLTISFPSAGDVFDIATGETVGSWVDGSPPASVSGSGVSSFINGVGARVKWVTGSFLDGNLVTGATFLVPLNSNAYTGAGNLDDTMRAAIVTAANTMITAAADTFRIYSRKTATRAGQVNAVTGATVPDAVSWLRSRRT